MSYRFEIDAYGYWTPLGNESGYACVGRPIYGAEHLGKVTFLGFREFGLEYFATENGCTASNGFTHPLHVTNLDYKTASSCHNCDFILTQKPERVYGFAWSVGEDGRLVFESGAYKAQVHGPFSARNMEDLDTQIAAFRTEWTVSHGPGPWYGWYDENSRGTKIAVYTIDDLMMQSSPHVVGPFDSIESAYEAAYTMRRDLVGSYKKEVSETVVQ